MIASAHNASAAILTCGALYIADQTSLGINEPSLAVFLFIAGLVSHYASDAIPHGHYKQPHIAFKDYLRVPKKRKKEIPLSTVIIGLTDLILSIFVFVVLFAWLIEPGSLIYLAIAIAGTQLPDLIMLANDSGIASNNRFVKLEQSFHAGPVHWHDLEDDTPRPWSWTDIWQILLFVLAVLICIQYGYLVN